MSTAVADATEALNEKLNEVVATTQVNLTIDDPEAVDDNGKPIRMVRRAETNLGDLCADAYLAQSGADIAFVNGGGIRVNIDAGDITLNNILKVHPFGNAMCVIEVTGQQILDALEWGSRNVPGELGGFLQVAGLSYEIHSYIESPCKVDENGMFAGIEGERRVKNVMVNGEPIDPDATYTLASHDYMLLNKGDGYTMFDGCKLLQDSVKLDNQVLIDYITETLGGVIGEQYEDPYGEGRIVIVEEAQIAHLQIGVIAEQRGKLRQRCGERAAPRGKGQNKREDVGTIEIPVVHVGEQEGDADGKENGGSEDRAVIQTLALQKADEQQQA